MSWAGKTPFKRIFRSLFRQEQAPSSLSLDAEGPVIPLSEEQMQELDRLVKAWVDEKGYRMPDKSIHEAAQRIGTTSPLLYRYCLTQGTDFRSWRTWLRIQDAQEQLVAEPDTPASTIARRVGINDRSNFTRQFRAITGFTPDQWRKMQK